MKIDELLLVQALRVDRAIHIHQHELPWIHHRIRAHPFDLHHPPVIRDRERGRLIDEGGIGDAITSADAANQRENGGCSFNGRIRSNADGELRHERCIPLGLKDPSRRVVTDCQPLLWDLEHLGKLRHVLGAALPAALYAADRGLRHTEADGNRLVSPGGRTNLCDLFVRKSRHGVPAADQRAALLSAVDHVVTLCSQEQVIGANT